jgi:hypothetical protein
MTVSRTASSEPSGGPRRGRRDAARRTSGPPQCRSSGLGFRPARRSADYAGTDVIIVRNRKIAALYVFLDSMPS